MKTYLININGKRKGPMTIEEVMKEEIDSETLVWYEGLSEWQKIKDADDFKDTIIPPKIQPKINFVKNNFQKKTAGFIKRFLIALLISSISSLLLSWINYQICISSIDCEMKNIETWAEKAREENKQYDESMLAVGGLITHSEDLEYLQCAEYNKFIVRNLVQNRFQREVVISNLYPFEEKETRIKFYFDLSVELFALLTFFFISLYLSVRVLIGFIRWMKKYSS